MILQYFEKLGFPTMFMWSGRENCHSFSRGLRAAGLCFYADGSQVIGSLWVCVCVCVCVGVCVFVGTRPSESGKHCHSYINKSDSRDRRWVKWACEG